jgi:tetratricopeptide (TPR) repeat protein
MIRKVLPAAGVFALVAALGFDGGGYAPTAWGWSSVVVFAVLAVLISRGVGRPRPAALALVAALAALAAWTAVSILWSSYVSASVLDVQRTLLYVGAASLFVLARPGPALPAGVLGAVVLISASGLVGVEAGVRLAEPVGYTNGMAILAVIGLLLAVGFAARAAHPGAAVLAATAGPMLAATLYFTLGRGAWLALAAGLVVAVAVGPGRLQFAATALVLAVPAAFAVVAADRLGPSASFTGLLVLLSALSALVPFALRLSATVYRPSQQVRRAFAAALVALPVLVAAAALVKLGGPAGAYDSFKAAPTPTHGDPSGRVFSLSGSNRADYWAVAWESYEDHPAVGAGAGTFARTWLRERPVPQPVVDAHSLYLETLSELGPLGLALLLVALAAPFAARRTHWTPVALAPYGAFVAHAAQDWDWELPAVTVTALGCGAALVAGQTSPRVPRAAAALPVGLCLLAGAAFLGNNAVERSVAASDRLEWGEAEDAARLAKTLQPWSPQPWRLLGEIELAEGSLAEARRYFRRGLREDRDDWELWIGLALASEGADRQAALREVRRLNPLSPELEELGFKTD